MHSIKNLRRRTVAVTTGGIAALAMAGAAVATVGATSASAATTAVARPAAAAAPASSGPFSFNLIPSNATIKSCLPHARGEATIIPGRQNDLMRVSVHGMPANSEFDLFVIQTPAKPFGVSWYQTDIDADRNGNGSATVVGIFDQETFSVSLGGTTSFDPTHQYHLGLWFNDPQLAFKLGCDGNVTTPTVTPFNGEQNAGPQVLNTANFPDNAGPLSHVHR